METAKTHWSAQCALPTRVWSHASVLAVGEWASVFVVVDMVGVQARNLSELHALSDRRPPGGALPNASLHRNSLSNWIDRIF